MKLILAALLALAAMPGSSRPVSPGYLVMDDSGDVVKYYGVPTTLSLSDVRSLRLPYRMSSEPSGEGGELRTVIVSAKNGVPVVVVFDHRGDSIDVKTRSRRAVDSRGVRVGDTLTRVQKLWPEGELYSGNSIEGGHRYAVFFTGTNVGLDLTPKNVGGDPTKVFVTEIHIYGFKTRLSTKSDARPPAPRR
jgi:hypothetical protein